MTIAQLMAAGYTEEQAKAIVKMHEDSINGNYVTKARFDEVNTAKTNLTAQLKERDEQLKELGTLTADKATADAKIKELTTANKEAQKKYDAELLKTRRNLAVRSELAGKAHNPDVVIRMLTEEQLNSIEVNDEGKVVKGLKEILTPLQKSDAYLFKTEGNGGGGNDVFKPYTPNGGNGGNTEQGGGNTAALDFAKSLAKDRTGAAGTADKATSHYFGNK